MPLTAYTHPRCSTCERALDWHASRGHGNIQVIDITHHAPPADLYRKILARGEYNLRQLFNTSGQVYRDLNMKERLDEMGDAEAVEMLSQNGMLCRRPVVTDGERHSVGFKSDQYERAWD